MINGIKPIETLYKGYRFRSRLEARWAVFFDTLGVEWEYEPEGFDLGDGLYYLPDFRIRNSAIIHQCEFNGVDIYVEVKGVASVEDIAKINKFTYESDDEYYWLNKYPLLVVGNIPEGDNIADIEQSMVNKSNSVFYSFTTIDNDYYYPAFPGVTPDGKFAVYGGDYSGYIDWDKTVHAFEKARQARWEHGEAPIIHKEANLANLFDF